MDFITTDQRIAVENFVIGNIYTITFSNAIYFSGSCIGKGADFVSFQRTAPELIFVLSMQTAPTVLAITEGGGGTGTTDYNALNNKPSINGETLIGALSLSALGIASADDLSALELDVDALTEDQGIDRAALVELVDSGAKNRLTQTDFSGTSQVNIPIYLKAGIYVIYRDNLTSNDTDSASCLCRFYDDSGGTNVQRASIVLARGENKSSVITVSGDTTFMRVYASDSAAHSTGDTITGTNFMVCTKVDWDISQAFQPYRPTYQELWDIVKAL